MVAHLLHFAKHVNIKWSSHMRRPIHLTVPLDKLVESRGDVVINYGCDSITRNKGSVRFCFHCLFFMGFIMFLIIFIYNIRCGIAQPVTRVGKTALRECRHSIGYLLTWATLYKSFAVLAAAYPSDVCFLNHILLI